QACAEVFRRTRPRVVAIYEDNFNFLSKMCLSRMRQVAFAMIDTARAGGSKVVVNGSDASDRYCEYLTKGADYVLLGEAEWTLLDIIQSLIGGTRRNPQDTCGLVHAQPQHSSLVRTNPRTLLSNLVQRPFRS